ncbi:MAG: polyprenyl synthetase family protein [Eubacterium sp.]|nr:polyprenyl synthetase family protein [Eubacterium sp.]
MDIVEEIRSRQSDIDEMILGFLPGDEKLTATLTQAMRYSVTAGGKRIRPMLMQEVSGLFGEPCKALPYFMAAIEFIHTYSLVHDDLPAMDDDDYRRGKETTHKVYGEAMGVLCGDALLNYAFEVAATSVESETAESVAATNDGTENASNARIEALRAVKALGILAGKAGGRGMIGGQVIDIETEGKAIDMETVNAIHSMKTCALIEAAMMIGAVLGGADDAAVKLCEKAGYELGMAFQIRDDILDVEGDSEVMGKPVGSDEKNDKTTFVTLVGIESANRAVKEHSESAITIIRSLGGEGTFLERLMEYMIYRNK